MRWMGCSGYIWMDGTPVHNIPIDERRNTERLNGAERNDTKLFDLK